MGGDTTAMGRVRRRRAPARAALLASAIAIGVVASACGASAGPAPVPTPTPVDAPHRALDAWTALVARPDLSFRMLEEATLLGPSGPGVPVRYEAAVSGRDFSARIRVNSQVVDVVAVGDVAYARLGSHEWVRGERDEGAARDVVDVWRYLGEPADLEYVGPSPKYPGGLVFRTTRHVTYDNAGLRQTGASGEVTSAYLVLDDNGVPMVIELNAEATTAGGDAGAGPVRVKATVTFSAVGEPITIDLPK